MKLRIAKNSLKRYTLSRASLPGFELAGRERVLYEFPNRSRRRDTMCMYCDMIVEKPKAVVLLSGGLDSITALALAQERGFEACALTFRYGQRHAVEIEAAKRIVAAMGVEHHKVIDIDLGTFGGSALTDDIPVPKNQESTGIPITYVPARNTVFLSLALAYAEVLDAYNIFVGVNAIDYSGYPDCRPAYIEAFEAMANLATRSTVEGHLKLKIHAPLIKMSKADIIREGRRLGIDYSLTSSCYDPDADGAACGECDACRLRLKGFSQAGIEDPVTYRKASARRAVA
jgi:7-cyano-7-deazaguanine synthase